MTPAVLGQQRAEEVKEGGMRTGIRDSELFDCRRESRWRTSVLPYIVLCLFLGAPAIAQQPQEPEEAASSLDVEAKRSPPKAVDESAQSTRSSQQGAQAEKRKRVARGAFVVAPLPISSPAVGPGIVPVLGYVFPFSTKDKVSPPSVVGAAGLVTNNGSRGFALGAQFYLKENRYRITSGFGRGNLNYDIYGNGRAAGLKLPLNQTGQAFFVEFLRRIGWKFFTGPRFTTGSSFITVRANRNTNFPIPPEVGLHTTLTAIGAQLTRDTLLNRFYPTDGTYFAFTSDFFPPGLGSKYSFQSFRGAFSKYGSLSAKQVLAYNAFFCTTGGSPPFYGNCIYGNNNQLRGYIAGQYFTRSMLATQLEYRLELPKRFGLVGFGGVGGAFPGGVNCFRGRRVATSFRAAAAGSDSNWIRSITSTFAQTSLGAGIVILSLWASARLSEVP
jgi:Omp85 superfamily domain